MLKSCHKLLRYRIQSADGREEMFSDSYFSQPSMQISYAAVRLRYGLDGHRLLIPMVMLDTPDHRRGLIPVLGDHPKPANDYQLKTGQR